MAHYAILDENNIVTTVIVGNEETDTVDGVEQDWEANYAVQHGVPTAQVKRTSYNTGSNKYYNPDRTLADDQSKAFRGNYAVIGEPYDPVNDVFLGWQPHDSWVLSEETWNYEPPIDYPTDGHKYTWDESIINWVKVEDSSNFINP
jgi:hypothetical protein